MEYVQLSERAVIVSRLCLGTLTVGPLQADLGIEQGSGVIAYALSRGINFLDTAQLYETYPIIKEALRKSGKFDTVISSKTYAYTKELAAAAVEEARRGIDRDYIDIFMLHEQESIHTLRGHMEALEYLLECRERGIICAVGASMHHISAVDGVCEIRDTMNLALDVIHPIYNMTGLGIVDGNADEMYAAMTRAKSRGCGIFAMKALGGGHLCKSAANAFDFVLDSGCVDAIAVGMQSEDEVDANIEYFEQRKFSEKSSVALSEKRRTLQIENYCQGCGLCVKRCPQNALSLADNRAVCDEERCVMCGYCSRECPLFAIKVW